jgi:hypothetical protein
MQWTSKLARVVPLQRPEASMSWLPRSGSSTDICPFQIRASRSPLPDQGFHNPFHAPAGLQQPFPLVSATMKPTKGNPNI